MANLDAMTPEGVALLYKMLNDIKDGLERQKERSASDEANLLSHKMGILEIEEWAKRKMDTEIPYTPEDILRNFGDKPTVRMGFYPGSDGYNKFGIEVVGSVSFSKDDLVDMFTNIANKVEGKARVIRFKKTHEETTYEVSTADFLSLKGYSIIYTSDQ